MYEGATDAPETCAVDVLCIALLLFPTLIKELRGESTDMESLPTMSPGADATPVIPCRARWARCRWRGVCCLLLGSGSVGLLVLVGDCGLRGGGVMIGPPTCSGGMTKRFVSATSIPCVEGNWCSGKRIGDVESETSTASRLISSLKFRLKNFSRVSWKGMNSGGQRCP